MLTGPWRYTKYSEKIKLKGSANDGLVTVLYISTNFIVKVREMVNRKNITTTGHYVSTPVIMKIKRKVHLNHIMTAMDL